MRWLILMGITAGCFAAAWLVVRPARRVVDTMRFDHARDLFRRRREWLEAAFLAVLARTEPLERVRWEDAHWQDEVLWARDRPTGDLLALIGVDFDPDPIFDPPDQPGRHSTALFEFRKGAWMAEGKRLDQIRPEEAMLRHRRLIPIVPHPQSRRP